MGFFNKHKHKNQDKENIFIEAEIVVDEELEVFEAEVIMDEDTTAQPDENELIAETKANEISEDVEELQSEDVAERNIVQVAEDEDLEDNESSPIDDETQNDDKPIDENVAADVSDEKEDEKPVAKPTAKKTVAKTAQPSSEKTYKGKFVISSESADDFAYQLVAPNRDTILTGVDSYASIASCKTAITNLKKIVETAEIEDQTLQKPVAQTSPKWEIYLEDEKFRFRLRAKNESILAISAEYKTKPSCKSAIKSICTNAPLAEVIREDS